MHVRTEFTRKDEKVRKIIKTRKEEKVET